MNCSGPGRRRVRDPAGAPVRNLYGDWRTGCYFPVNLERLWNTVQKDLPHLEELERSGYNEGPFLIRLGDHMGRSWDFITAVGELRGVFGIHLAKIAVAYGIDIEEDLASIIPDLDIGDDFLTDDGIKMIKSLRKKK